MGLYRFSPAFLRRRTKGLTTSSSVRECDLSLVSKGADRLREPGEGVETKMDTRSVGLSDDLDVFPATDNRWISLKDILLFVTKIYNVQVQRRFGDIVFLSGNLFALDFQSCAL